MCSIYPLVTYPAHASMMTGCRPGKHGIYSNGHFKTVGGYTLWHLEHSELKVENIFAAAKRQGKTTASVYWPITGCNPNIDHVINEYFFYYPGEGDRVEEIFGEQGADEVALQAVKENLQFFPRSVRGSVPTEKRFDAFLMGCACSLIRNIQPDVLLVHNCEIDSERHKSGVFGDHIKEALDRTDLWLGDVIAAMEDAGVLEQTDFILLSDHGQREYTKLCNINALLQEGGFLQVAPDGKLYEWQAYAQSNGHSTTVYLRDNTNKKLYDRVYAYLQKLQENQKFGIEKIFTKDELLEKYGQSGPYSFMIEAVEGCGFGSKFGCEAVETGKKKCGHGYMPEKGSQPVFMAHGPSFRDGAVLANARMVDIAPTLAETFGEKMAEADGRCLEELLIRTE